MQLLFSLPPLDEQAPFGWCRGCGGTLYSGDQAACWEGGLLCRNCAPEELPLLAAEEWFLFLESRPPAPYHPRTHERRG